MHVKTEPIKLGLVSKTEEKEIAVILKKHYGFDILGGTIKRFLEKTASSKVYKCKTNQAGEIVVKKSFWYKEANLKEQKKIIGALEKAYFISEALREKGVSLPKVFCNKEKRFVSLVNSEKFIVLEYLGGRHFSSKDNEFISSGKALGTFHQKGKEYLAENPKEKARIFKTIPVEKSYEDSRQMYYKFLRRQLLRPHQCSVLEVCQAVRENIKVIDEIIKFLDSSGISSPSLSSGIVHNDFNTNNALFNPNGSFSGFLDIDQMGIAPYIWDIGNTLASFASNFLLKNPQGNFGSKARLFLRAYHKEFPLPLAEYQLCLAATQRWDIMRILRSLRRHHYENNRLPGLLPKIKDRLIPRIIAMPKILSFINKDWLRKNLK